MLRANNFNLEWGYLAPAPSFLRTVRLVAVAAAIAATASAAVVFALMRQPAAEELIAARTLMQSVDQAPPAGPAPVAAEAQNQAEHEADAGISGQTSAHPRARAAVALPEAPRMMPDVPLAREASEISASPVRGAAPPLQSPNKNPRLVSRDQRPVVAASSARIALARFTNRPAPPAASNATHNSALRHDNANVVHRDESVVGWAIGVTGHIVAATQRAISAMPSWIGSIGKEGQSPRQAVPIGRG